MTDEVEDDAGQRPGYSLERYNLTTDKIIETLKKTRGDVLVSAKALGLSLREFDRMLNAIPGLREVLGMIEEVKATNSDYRKWSEEAFEREADRVMSLYRLVALESLYELASMPINEKNAALMNVKREASVNLLGKDERGGTNIGEMSEFFKGLNEQYLNARPRVIEIRERLVTLQVGQPSPRAATLEGSAQRIEPPSTPS